MFPRSFLLFDINVKEQRNPGNEVAEGLNWMKCIRSELNEKKLGNCTGLNKLTINCSYALVLTSDISVLLYNKNNFGDRAMHGKTIWKPGINEITKVSMGFCPCTPQGGFTMPPLNPQLHRPMYWCMLGYGCCCCSNGADAR